MYNDHLGTRDDGYTKKHVTVNPISIFNVSGLGFASCVFVAYLVHVIHKTTIHAWNSDWQRGQMLLSKDGPNSWIITSSTLPLKDDAYVGFQRICLV